MPSNCLHYKMKTVTRSHLIQFEKKIQSLPCEIIGTTSGKKWYLNLIWVNDVIRNPSGNPKWILKHVGITMLWKWVKTTPMRKKTGYLFRAWNNKGVSLHHLHFTKTQRQAGELKSFAVYIFKKGFKYVLIRTCWHRKAGGTLTGSKAFYVLVWGAHLTSSGWPWVGIGEK